MQQSALFSFARKYRNSGKFALAFWATVFFICVLALTPVALKLSHMHVSLHGIYVSADGDGGGDGGDGGGGDGGGDGGDGGGSGGSDGGSDGGGNGGDGCCGGGGSDGGGDGGDGCCGGGSDGGGDGGDGCCGSVGGDSGGGDNGGSCSSWWNNCHPAPKTPSCEISANPSEIIVTDDPVLTWTSKNATSAKLDQGIGSVSLSGSKSVFLTETTTYTLTVKGSRGTATCHTTIKVKKIVTPKPVCDISASASYINKGDASSLWWTSENATSVTISGIGAVAHGGSTSVTPSETTTYVMKVSGPGGEAQCQTKIKVKTPPPPHYEAPSCDITATPMSIHTGDSSTLSWHSQNATSASIDQGIGEASLNNDYDVSPHATTKYTLTVVGSGGTAKCHVTITVTEVPHYNSPSCWIDASPDYIYKGNSTLLQWGSSNATSASIDQGVGSVSLSGSRNTEALHSSQTFTLTVWGPGGSVTCHTNVEVREIPQQNAPYCTMYANPTHVQNGGGNSYLSWSSSNASSASLSNYGSVAVNGSQSAYVGYSREFTLTVYGYNGQTAQCHTTVTVDSAPHYDRPSCSIYLSNTYNYGFNNYDYNNGNRTATLSWNSDNATSASIAPYVGSVSLDGSRVVNISGDGTFTLTVWGPGGTATCSTHYYPPVVTPNYPFISLTQIPYSGFDFGEVGNTIYWLSLISFALAGGYLAIYYMPLVLPRRSTTAYAALSQNMLPAVIPTQKGNIVLRALRAQFRACENMAQLSIMAVQSLFVRGIIQ